MNKRVAKLKVVCACLVVASPFIIEGFPRAGAALFVASLAIVMWKP